MHGFFKDSLDYKQLTIRIMEEPSESSRALTAVERQRLFKVLEIYDYDSLQLQGEACGSLPRCR